MNDNVSNLVMVSTQSTTNRNEATRSGAEPDLVIGVGASAGGLDACRSLIASAPVDRGLAFVVIAEADAERQIITSILSSATAMQVVEVSSERRVEGNAVYVVAPTSTVTIQRGVLRLGALHQADDRSQALETFLTSLAADQKERAVGIVLSGSGNSAAGGLQEIKSAGGLCLVQDPDTAEYDDVLRAAMGTAAIDAIATPGEMGKILARYALPSHPRPFVPRPRAGARTAKRQLRSPDSDPSSLLASAEIALLLLDRALHVRYSSGACAEALALTAGDVGRRIDHVRTQVDDPDLVRDARRVLETLAPIEREVAAADGRWFTRRVLPYRTEDERIDGVCITFHDISAQKRAFAESEEQRRFAETIFCSSRTPLLVLDAQRRIVSASHSFCELFGTGDEDSVGESFYEVGQRRWDIPQLRTVLDELLPRAREIRNYDIEPELAGLGSRALRLNAVCMEHSSLGELTLLSIDDVTDLREAQTAAQQRTRELRLNHRRKDEFLAMLGHELRNPLAAIKGGIDLIRMTEGIPDRVEQVGAMMIRQTQRMTSMIDQLLDIGRVISGKLTLVQEAVDMTCAIESAIETVMPLIDNAQQRLAISLPPRGTVLVLGDSVRLAQVVENLLTNASKYTEARGHLWVTAAAAGDRVTIAVRDSGVGMDPEVLAHAFDLFTQSPRSMHRSKGGLGLGLPLVRKLVQMHRGAVVARSDGPGKGSELVVTLPRLHAGHLGTSEGDQTLELDLPQRTVLLVEDESDAAAVLAGILATQGQRVRIARDGFAALEDARELRPDVVLLDIGLPDMNGYEVAERLREEHDHPMRIIAMTGFQKEPHRLRQSGFDGYLLKPIDVRGLFAMLAESESESD